MPLLSRLLEEKNPESLSSDSMMVDNNVKVRWGGFISWPLGYKAQDT